MPHDPDVITQAQIKTLLLLHARMEEQISKLRGRVEDGAKVEPGEFVLELDGTTSMTNMDRIKLHRRDFWIFGLALPIRRR